MGVVVAGRDHDVAHVEFLVVPQRLDASSQSIKAGGTGSGKTTLMKAILDHVPATDRLIVIEQVAELQVLQPNALRWEAVDAIPGQVAVLPSALLAAALRHRPDRIIFGEIRDECANVLLQAMNTAHGGTLTTLHAEIGVGCAQPVVQCRAQCATQYQPQFIRSETAEAIDFVLYCEREQDGRRRVRELISVSGYDFDSQPSSPKTFTGLKIMPTSPVHPSMPHSQPAQEERRPCPC